jgi:predicted LPLAT superfamily acyltransferase
MSRFHKTGFDMIEAPASAALFCGVQGRLSLRIINDHGRLVEADLGRGAIAVGDHLAPFGVVDALGRLAAFPEIAAAAGAAFGIEQVIFAY